MNVVRYHQHDDDVHHTKKKAPVSTHLLASKKKPISKKPIIHRQPVSANHNLRPLDEISSSATVEEDSILVEEGEKRVLIFCSIPIICIAVISVFHIIINHTPFYYYGHCKQVHCVAGSGEQFAMWTILFILLVYAATHFIYRFNSKSKAREKVWASA
jgi:hypothetical protein